MILFTASNLSSADNKNLNTLILNVATGDISALEELYNKTKTEIYGFALSVLKNPDDAERVLHNTCLSVWKSAYMYFPENKPMPWIITIAKTHCYRVLRNRKWNTESEDFKNIFENKPLIWRNMDTLDDDERKIIALFAVANFKYIEIMDFLNIPFLSLALKYNKAMKKLSSANKPVNRMEIKKSIKSDVEKTIPYIWQGISDDVKYGRGEVVTVTPQKKKGRVFSFVSSVLAALVLISAAVFGIANYNRAELKNQTNQNFSSPDNKIIYPDKIDNIISPEDAIKKVLYAAGLSSKNVSDVQVEFDDNNGNYRYEVEFYYNGYEYEYKIDAISGNIIESYKKIDD